MKAEEFLLKHSNELSKKYAGKYIAVIGDKVVAVSRSAIQAYKDAKKMFPKEEIAVFYMPTEEETVTLL